MTTYLTQQHANTSSGGGGGGENFEDLTLEEIQRELIELIELADQGYDIDEKRFDWLLQAQEANEEYQEMMEIERRHWRESIEDFVRECLERTRTFVPVNIFDCTHEDLVALGLSEELAKRLLQRQCLWLVRMGQDEISRLHESDLLGRFNCQQQHLDIIETAAVYASLPEEFRFDPAGRKKDWRAGIEDTLRQMLMENDQDLLPIEKIRNPCYEGKQFGPVTDITSVRYVEIHKATDVRESRKSFIAICKEHSIMSRFNSINGRSRSTTIKSNAQAQKHSDGTITPPPSRQERVDGEPDDGEGALLPEEAEELAEEAEIHLRLSLANGEEMNLNVVRGEEEEAEADTAAVEEEEETEIDALTESLAETAIQAETEAKVEVEAEAEAEAEAEEEAKTEVEAINESCAEASEECQDKAPDEEDRKEEQEEQQEEAEAEEEVEEEEVAQSTEDINLVSDDAPVKDEEKEEESTTIVQPEEQGEADEESAEEGEGEEHSEVKELRAEEEEDEEPAPQSEEQEEQVVVEESEHTPDEESETY